MSDSADNKILGIVPKDQYVKYTYFLLLAAGAGGLLLSVLALIGVIIPIGGLFQLAGIVGLIMALLGVAVYPNEFSTHDKSHLIYIAIVVGAFIVVSIVIGASFFQVAALATTIVVLVSAFELLLLFTGYNSWAHARTVTKENIKGEVQLALKRL